MKISRAILIPGVLLVYLAVMSVMGWEGYASGRTSPLMYFGVIAVTLGIIVLLHFTIKKRERLRQERLNDILQKQTDKDN